MPPAGRTTSEAHAAVPPSLGRRSVMATLREPKSLKVAFTDFRTPRNCDDWDARCC